jgi:hypothetical protein
MLYNAAMTPDFLGTFLGSPARAQVLRIFALNQSEVFTASQVSKRSRVNRAAANREINALERLGIVKKAKSAAQAGKGKRTVAGKPRSAGKPRLDKQKEKAWSLNQGFKYVGALSRFVHEVSPMQYNNIMNALKRSGRLATVILSGSFVGDPTRPADLVVAVDGLDERRLETVIRTLEPAFGREIRYAAFSTPEFRYRLTVQDRLIQDTLDYPHVVLFDRLRLL